MKSISKIQPEAFIGTQGVWLNNQFYSWRGAGFLGRFESYTLKKGELDILYFNFSVIQSAGGMQSLFLFRQHTSIAIPVPKDCLVEAEAIASR